MAPNNIPNCECRAFSSPALDTSLLYSVMGCGASTPDDGGGETYAGTDSNAYTIGMPSIHSVGSACAVDVRAC